MKLKKIDERTWVAVRPDGETAALFRLDLYAQVERLLLRTAEATERRLCLELALAHAISFVRERRWSNILFTRLHRDPNLTPADSDCLMDFGLIPARVSSLNDVDLERSLKGLVEVLHAESAEPDGAFAATLREVEEATGRRVLIEQAAHCGYPADHASVTFALAPGHGEFRFWRTCGEPPRHERDLEHMLYILPAYHPAARRQAQAFLINGDTEALIRGHEAAVYSILAPPDSCAGRPGLLSTSWSRQRHPYRSSGPRFTATVDLLMVMTGDGQRGLRSLLLAALEHNGNYIAVSGGFRPNHLEYPSNVIARRAHLSQGVPRREARGSEAICVWEYRTLQAEGELERATVPPWFLREGWLDLYPEPQKKTDR